MRYPYLSGILAVIVLLFCAPTYAWAGLESVHSNSVASLFGAWRWVDDALNWLKGLGMDRSRLVQIWLLFMIIGLYIIMRIKPRA